MLRGARSLLPFKLFEEHRDEFLKFRAARQIALKWSLREQKQTVYEFIINRNRLK